MMHTPSALNRQSGALFGLDARIAMAVFAVLTLVGGYTVVNNMDSSRAKSLSHELGEVGRAVEGIHNDLKTDIFKALDEPTDKNAFAALFDNMVVTERGNLRSKWLGPYISFTSTTHARYGEMAIQKHASNHTKDCNPDELCYLWLVYSNVKPNIITEVNEIMDGEKESNPDQSGRIQWTADRNAGILFYRVAKALSMDNN